MRSKRFAALLLTFVCCLVFSAGCKEGKPSVDGSPGEGRTEEKGQQEKKDEISGESADETDAGTEDREEPISLGEFSTEDIYGTSYTQEMFADYRLTMVNVFATWCSPCIREIPDLEKLKNEVADSEVNLVGIVLDTADGEGGVDPEAVEKAKTLAEQLGVTYPFLVPDAGYLNGLLLGVSAVPTTFFVDQEGNLIGEVYLGSHSLEEWREIVKTELEGASP